MAEQQAGPDLQTCQSPQRLNRDRDEEDLRGQRDALARIDAEASNMPSDEQTIERLHARRIWDAGQYQEKDGDGDIVERGPDGTVRVRFRTVPAAET